MNIHTPIQIPTHTIEMSAVEGLSALLESIHRIENKEEIILLRMMPTEIGSTIYDQILHHQGGTNKQMLYDYLYDMHKIIQGGDIGVSFWDKSIYGRVEGGNLAARFNEDTWSFIEETFFSDPVPDTTVIGITPKIPAWLWVVCTSRFKTADPSDMICSLKLSTTIENGNIIPDKGIFSTVPEVVKRDLQEIRTTEDHLRQFDKLWFVAGLAPDKRIRIKQEIHRFLLG